MQANLVALTHRPFSVPSAAPRPSITSELVGPGYDFLPLLQPSFPRSDSSSSDSLYSLATTNTTGTSFKDPSILPSFGLSPLGYSPFPSLGRPLDSPPPLPTDGYSPSAFVLSLPAVPVQPTQPHLLPRVPAPKDPLPLSLAMAAAALTLPSPPETVVEERWTSAAAEPAMLSPVDMIRRILGKGKRGSAKRRKEIGRA